MREAVLAVPDPAGVAPACALLAGVCVRFDRLPTRKPCRTAAPSRVGLQAGGRVSAAAGGEERFRLCERVARIGLVSKRDRVEKTPAYERRLGYDALVVRMHPRGE